MSEQILNQILSELRELRSEVVELKSEVVELKSDVVELKSDVVELKSDVAKLDLEVASLKGRQDEIYQIVRALEYRADEHSAQIANLSENMEFLKGELTGFRREVNERLSEFEKSMEQNQRDIEFLRHKQSKVEQEVWQRKMAVGQ